MERRESRLVLVASGPAHAGPVISLVEEMARQGMRVAACYVQDGVLCTLGGHETAAGRAVARTLEAGVACYSLAEDLQLRGFDRADALSGVELLDYDGLARLMLEEYDRTLGAL